MVPARRWRHMTLHLRHPIQRLHPELLAEIFTHCIPTEIVNGRYRSISIRDAPILLCRVCSSWKSLAISTPRLWQRFFIDSGRLFIGGQYNPVLESLPRGIRTWLGRSGALPLNIRFVLSARTEIIAINALEALFEFSARWNYITIEVSPSVPWPIVGVLPNLHVFDGGFFPITQFPFTSAPSLKVLQVNKLPLNPVSISRIPWGQLTELVVNLVAPILAVLDILRGCPLLEMLTIPIGDRIADDANNSLPPSVLQIKHDTLRWLWLYVKVSTFGPSTVEYLTLPALKVLRLGGWPGSFNPYCYSQVLNLLTRSKCNLQGLAIMESRFEPDSLLEYLKHPSCQTLTSLDISENDVGMDVISVLNSPVLSHLTYPEEQGKAPLCPRLAVLRFDTCYRSEVSPAANAMGRMIQSRCFGRASDEQLRSLNLVTRYPISPEDNELLQLAEDESGLRLSYEALEDYPAEEEVPSYACSWCRDSGVSSNLCYWCYVSGQEDESEEESDDDGSEEDLDGDGSEEDSDGDGSEEDSDDDGSDANSDDDGSEEDSDDDGSEEDSDGDSVREDSGIKLTIRLPKIQTSKDFEESSVVERQLGWKWQTYTSIVTNT